MGGTIEDLHYDDALRLAACRDLLLELAARGLKLDLSPEKLKVIVEAGMSAYKDWALATMNEASPEDIWTEWIMRDLDVPRTKLLELAEFMAAFWETRFYARRLRPGARATIRELKGRGLKVGLISNTQSRFTVLELLRQYGLDGEIYPAILSSRFGRRKPHPSIFLEAARLAGVQPASSVYVGDTFSRDISGAFAAGFRGSVLIRSGLTDESDLPYLPYLPAEIKQNYVEVSSLEEIPDLLDQFEQDRTVVGR